MSDQQDPELQRAKQAAADADRALDAATRGCTFADEVSSVADRQVKLAEVGAELTRARSRGWVWGPDLADTHARLLAAAPGLVDQLRRESGDATQRVRGRIEACRARLSRTPVSSANRSDLEAIEEEAEAVKATVEQEAQRLDALAKPFVEPFDRLKKDVGEAHEHLDRFDEARFQLAPGEHPFVTGECAWQDAPGGVVNGFLYLTDKRIRFEQKETIKTKKFLFFTASSEDKHECLIDEPIGNIAASDDSTKGLVFKDQLVTIQWQNTRLKKSVFDINSGESAKLWDTWIEELRSGQIAHRMAGGVAVPAPDHGMPVDAPTRCTACDANLDAPVRGMTVLVCRYCGQRHDLRFA
ncbi:MAG: hypothetical protein H6738_01940 [Alphaproteobacteria bacterium]|nr:hypothetical protein [Alphaproteobacteria bacterium]MCB9695530.1 hypothetical protein [Alphaproteobacteria bacterium]